MNITKKTVSKVPFYLTWLVLIAIIYLNMKGISKEMVSELPKSTNIILATMAGLFLFRFFLEKVLPKKEVIFAKKENHEIIIESGSIKYFKQTISINEISDIKIGKTYFSNSLYIFLKNGNVKVISDDLSELERLYSFINEVIEKQ